MGNFFAPKEGDVRIRDIIRELPGATLSFGKEVAQGTARSIDFLGRKITGQKVEGKEESKAEKVLFGEGRRADTLGGVAESEVGIDASKHKIAAPLIGLGLVAADAFGGKGSSVKKGARAAGFVSDSVENSLAKDTTGMRKTTFDFFKKNPAEAAKGEVRLREIEDGKVVIEDGRHRLEYARAGGPMPKLVDVTSEYTGKPSDAVSRLIKDAGLPDFDTFDHVPSVRRAIGSNQHKERWVKSVTDQKRGMPNIDRLKMPPEAKVAVKADIEASRPIFEKQVGGRLSNKEIEDMASTQSKVMTKVLGRDKTAELESALTATRAFANSKAQDWARVVAEGGDATKAQAEMLDSFKVAQSQMTHHARMLQSGNINVGPREQTPLLDLIDKLRKNGHDIDELIDSAKKIDPNDADAVTDWYRSFEAASVGEWLDLVRYNSMLSSPLTHAINVASTALNAAIVRPLTKAVAGGLDFMAHPLNKAARKQFAAEVGPYAAGFVANLGKASRKFGGVMKGTEEFTNLDMRHIRPGTGKAAKFLSFPMRVLEATDQFWMEAVTGAEMRALGYRARKTGKAIDNADDLSLDTAKYTAYRRELFNDDQGMVLDAVDRATSMVESARNNKNPLIAWPAKLFIPFLHTPMNIIKQGIEYSPAGLATVKGAANKPEQLAKALLGTGVGLGMINLAMSDRMTFEEPKNKDQKDAWRKAGRQPMSIKVGDKWVSYEKLPPAIGFPMAITAAVTQGMKEQKVDESTAVAVLGGMAKAQSFYADQSYFKGIGDLIAAASGEEYAIERAASNTPQQFIPLRAMSGWIARLLDDTQRTLDPNSTFAEKQLELLFLNIPKIREDQTPRTDKFGEPIEAKSRVRNAFSPLKTTDSDVKFEEFLKDYETYAKVSRDADRESTILREKATEHFNRLIQMDPEEARQELEMMERDDPELVKKIVDMKKDRKGGLTANESLIKNMRVEARAQYVYDKVKEMDDRERTETLEHYEETGILTKRVMEEINVLRGQ